MNTTNHPVSFTGATTSLPVTTEQRIADALERIAAALEQKPASKHTARRTK